MRHSQIACFLSVGILLSPALTYPQTLNTILAKLQAVEERLDSITGDNPAAITEKIASIEHRVASIDNAHQQDLSRINSRIEELDTTPVANPVSHEDIEMTLAPVRDRLEQIEVQLASAHTASAGNNDEFRLLVADLSGLVGELRTALETPGSVNPPMPSEMITTDVPGIAVSGFGDFFYSLGESADQDAQIHIGQVEIDVESGIADYVGFAGALVYDAGSESFCLGDLFIDFNVLGTDGQYVSIAGIENGGIMVGQFDIPFGIDFNVYPSIDRRLVSGPLVVEHTHGCWGDVGLQIYGEGSRYNVAVYGVNGFGYEDRSGENVAMNMSAGGRFGIMPLEGVEIGGSYAGFLNENSVTDMAFTGIDFQAEFAAICLKSEYVEHRMGIAGDNAIANKGYYCQGMYDFGRYFAVARYGSFTPDGGTEITRTSTGLGYVVHEGLEFRAEYQMNKYDADRTFFQMVLGI